MYENQTITTEKTFIDCLKEYLAGALSFGLVLAATHGALLGNQHGDLAPTDFKAKVASELHTHSDIHVQHNHILVDPKSLRAVRSEGDKTAERDLARGGWDAYQI
jgi:hypothetical protein